MQFIQRMLSEMGIYWRTEMDDVRGLDMYIFAESQLNYRFDVQLPYSEPSGLYDGAAESVWDVRSWHNIATGSVTTRDYNYRTASTPMDATISVRSDAVIHDTLPARIESCEKNDIYAHLIEQGHYRVKLGFYREGTGPYL